MFFINPRTGEPPALFTRRPGSETFSKNVTFTAGGTGPIAPSCYCRSYSPLLTRFNTVNPAFLASDTESGLSLTGELNVERTLRTGFLQAGQRVKGAAETGRRKVNFPPHTAQLPSHNSYS